MAGTPVQITAQTVQAARQGDPEARRAIFEHGLEPTLACCLLASGKNEAQARALVQEVFTLAFGALDAHDAHGALHPWLCTIAAEVCARRGHSHHRTVLEAMGRVEEAAMDGATSPASELTAALIAALAREGDEHPGDEPSTREELSPEALRHAVEVVMGSRALEPAARKGLMRALGAGRDPAEVLGEVPPAMLLKALVGPEGALDDEDRDEIFNAIAGALSNPPGPQRDASDAPPARATALLTPRGDPTRSRDALPALPWRVWLLAAGLLALTVIGVVAVGRREQHGYNPYTGLQGAGIRITPHMTLMTGGVPHEAPRTLPEEGLLNEGEGTLFHFSLPATAHLVLVVWDGGQGSVLWSSPGPMSAGEHDLAEGGTPLAWYPDEHTERATFAVIAHPDEAPELGALGTRPGPEPPCDLCAWELHSIRIAGH